MIINKSFTKVVNIKFSVNYRLGMTPLLHVNINIYLTCLLTFVTSLIIKYIFHPSLNVILR